MAEEDYIQILIGSSHSEIQMVEKDRTKTYIFGGAGMPKFCFGPHYTDVRCKILSEVTFEKIVSKSKGSSAEVRESYQVAMNDELMMKARALYRDNDWSIITMSSVEFRSKMIHDGCLMIMLSLHCLGYSEYGNPAFFPKWTPGVAEDALKSIFFPGNQVCILVLEKLLQQEFFMETIATIKWRKPSSLLLIVLYQILRKPGITDEKYMLHEEPIDVLHALRILVLGRTIDLYSVFGDPDGRTCSRASELIKKGIRFKVVKDIGIRGIKLKDTYIGRELHLPFPFNGGHLSMIFQILQEYECTPNFNTNGRIVTSYLGLLKDLIPDIHDAKILSEVGVIEDDLDFRLKLVNTLGAMECSITYKPIETVKLQLYEYTGVKWLKHMNMCYKAIVAIGSIASMFGIFGAIEYFEKK